MKRLLKSLTGLGKETIEAISRSRKNPAEQMSGLCHVILDLKGEAAAVVISEELLVLYQESGTEERLGFLKKLGEEFSPDPEKVQQAITAFQEEQTPVTLLELNRATESPRQELFRMLNMAPDGTSRLIQFRRDLLGMLPDNPELDVVNQDLLHLFRSWFNRGFLELRRIDWQTPALILEKLIEYESVHEIKGWDDLRRRLQDDRRCFAFFHPVIPHIPLIFVEVALTRSVSDNITDLLEQPVPDDDDKENVPTCAIFYSINNCLDGLRGVSFGNLLIKQVVARLEAEFPKLKNYATLSPVPGFTRWLKASLEELDYLDEEEKIQLGVAVQAAEEGELNWEDDAISAIGLKVCAAYLVNTKSRGKPANSVARFHLGNGARLESINWAANLSEDGQKQSLGIMVNYLYDRSEISRNHEAYESEDKVICSDKVKKLLPG